MRITGKCTLLYLLNEDSRSTDPLSIVSMYGRDSIYKVPAVLYETVVLVSHGVEIR